VNEIKARISEYWDQVRAHRRYMHENPEPSHQEENTAAYVANALLDLGIPIKEHVGGYGVIGLIEGEKPGKCVALRADMDALEVTEATGAPFASQVPGVMHACGHDMHTAMLLGAAYVLNSMRDRLQGTVKLIFQPAEEDAVASGAKSMIADGCLENPHVDAIFAQHVWPDVPMGKIAVRNHVVNAASDRFFLTIHGKSSHGGASPNEGVDAVVIAAQIVNSLQTIVSRNTAPLQGCVLSIGTIHGGTRYNVVADTVRLEGTCRNLDPSMRKTMGRRIAKIASGVAESMGGTCDVDYRLCYGVNQNAPEAFTVMSESVVEAFGPEALIHPEHASLCGEDFSYYGETIPAGFAWLGCRQEDAPLMSLHSSEFLPAEEIMQQGIAFLVTTAVRFLNQTGS